MESEDEDPFNFKPLKRIRKSGLVQPQKKQNMHRAATTISFVGYDCAGKRQLDVANGIRTKSKLDKKSSQTELESKVKSAGRKEESLSSKCGAAASMKHSEVTKPIGQIIQTGEPRDNHDRIIHRTISLGSVNTNDEKQKAKDTLKQVNPNETSVLETPIMNLDNSSMTPSHIPSVRKIQTKSNQTVMRPSSRKRLTAPSNINGIKANRTDGVMSAQLTSASSSSLNMSQTKCLELVEETDMQFERDGILISVPKMTGRTASERKTNGSVKDVDIQVDKVRCPFCQLPFSALNGLSPNWHTMECMDIPLKATEECPGGLTCDSTIPGHYRRYTHSQVALHLAGQHQSRSCNFDRGAVGTFDDAPEKIMHSPSLHQDWSLKAEETKSSSQESQQSTKNSRPRKRKSLTKSENKYTKSKSRNTSETGSSQSCPQSQESQSQSSESSCSILSYFSPCKKKTSSVNSTQYDSKTDVELDPVLRLLVMSDSDSDDNTESTTDIEKANSDREQCIPEQTWKAEERSEIECANAFENDEGTGFIQESDGQECLTECTNDDDEIVTRNASAENKESLDLGAKSPQIFQVLSKPAAPVTLQKQTSLFSFFKPCVGNTPKQQTVSKTSAALPAKLGTEWKRKNSFQRTTKPPLTKTASEPVKLMRVPSPPPSVPLKNVVVNSDKQQASKRRPSTAAASASFSNSSGRQCPFYKKMPGTTITVDAFCYGEIPGCEAYVLTHFHFDHYRGLTKRFSQPMYCSSVTANLVETQIGVPSRWINRLPLNTPQQVAGVWLTLMEANHCPGAVIILFELPSGKKLLHTGDFRADPCMEQYPVLVNVAVDELYLDTTYCSPAYAFPSQKEVIQFAVSTALKAIEQEPNLLIVCGAYTIGKERIFIALAEALQTKICVQSAKKRVLDCLEDDKLKKMVTLKPTDGCVHVLPMRQLNARGLDQHLQLCPQFSSVLAFEPTGWTHSNTTVSLDTLKPKFSSHKITVYGVPYSEHSSFLEMKRFVQFLRPKKILPTVNNGSAASRRKMEAIFKQWLAEGSSQTVQNALKLPAQQSLGTWLKK